MSFQEGTWSVPGITMADSPCASVFLCPASLALIRAELYLPYIKVLTPGTPQSDYIRGRVSKEVIEVQ